MRVLSCLLFFPRGGSSHVARALASGLGDLGHEVTVVSGSRSRGPGDARAFYAGLDVRPVDFDRAQAPMHPSYEDRPGAADPCFGRVGERGYDAQVDAWSAALADAGAAEADVLHLHHLTPLHEAAARVAPGVPVVTHLHGTELLFLEQVARDPGRWPHGAAWAQRMRTWAAGSARLVVPAASLKARATAALGLSPGRCVVVSNGVDLDTFFPAPVDRGAHWRRVLCEEPRGWAPGQPAGSVRYAPADVAHLATEPVVVAAGRFTSVKRLPLLIRAFGRVRAESAGRPSLVLAGGHPGEYEGEHPLDAVRASGAEGVYLAGWQDHAELATCFQAADLAALASVREQFGLVLVEAMACGLPVVAVDRLGPAAIVDDGRTGWLVPPDDEDALAQALAAALDDDAERRRRGALARTVAVGRYGWEAVATDLADVLGAVAARSPGAPLAA